MYVPVFTKFTVCLKDKRTATEMDKCPDKILLIKILKKPEGLLIYTAFSLGETNALIIFIVEYNSLMLTGTFALGFDLVPS